MMEEQQFGKPEKVLSKTRKKLMRDKTLGVETEELSRAHGEKAELAYRDRIVGHRNEEGRLVNE